MKKLIYRSVILLIIFLLIIAVYLSTFGLKTDKFNSKIISQIKQIEPNIELKLNDVSATLDLFNFGINAKTVGTDLIYKNKIIKIQTIKTNISIKSFINNKFALKKIFVSTKSLAIKDLIPLIRLKINDPKLFIAEQFIKKGFLIADIELEFDELGNVKNNYELNGFVKDAKINLFKRYNLNKIDFIFAIKEKNLKFNDIEFFLNQKNILIPELTASKKNKEYLISGNLNNKNTTLNKDEVKNYINGELFDLDIEKITFSSKNNFKFKIKKNFKFENLEINSNINLNLLKLNNSFKLADFFPKIKKDLIFKNQKINFKYKKENININGEGEIFIQNEIDTIKYEILKKKKELSFNTTLNILKNSFKVDLLNFEKKKILI